MEIEVTLKESLLINGQHVDAGQKTMIPQADYVKLLGRDLIFPIKKNENFINAEEDEIEETIKVAKSYNIDIKKSWSQEEQENAAFLFSKLFSHSDEELKNIIIEEKILSLSEDRIEIINTVIQYFQKNNYFKSFTIEEIKKELESMEIKPPSELKKDNLVNYASNALSLKDLTKDDIFHYLEKNSIKVKRRWKESVMIQEALRHYYEKF
jgi:sulfur relay (sulfurtransferase) DsrC/TusE family protein